MKIKRYFCDQHYVEAGFSLDPKGRWVRYEDHKAVITKQQAEIDGLKKENKFITEGSNRALKVQQTEIDKAIKLLDAAVCPCCDKSGAYYDNDGGVCQCQWCAEVEALKHKGVKSGKS